MNGRQIMMNEVQTKALENGLRWLTASGAQFAVIDANGNKHGTLELAPPPSSTKRSSHVKRGSYKEIYEAPLSTLQPNQTVEIEVPGFAPDGGDSFAASVSSRCREMWGPGQYMTHSVKRDGKTFVQVLRA